MNIHLVAHTLTATQGTGTGTWATDVGDQFPGAQVIGTDLSPVPPGMQPDNVTFEIDDCCSEWIYPDNHFDLVHIRGLFGSIADWPQLYKEAFRHIRPGGYIEQMEWSVHNRSSDGTLSPDAVLARWSQNAIRAGTITGKTFEVAENMAGLIREAGFVDVVEKRFRWPVGPWSSDPKLKEIGRWNLLNWEEGMEGWVMAAYTRVLGVSLHATKYAILMLIVCSGRISKSRNGYKKCERRYATAISMCTMKCK